MTVIELGSIGTTWKQRDSDSLCFWTPHDRFIRKEEKAGKGILVQKF